MFITLTIDTAQAKKAKKLRFHRKKFSPVSGWKKGIHMRRRSLLQKLRAWRRSLKGGHYKLGGQIAMF